LFVVLFHSKAIALYLLSATGGGDPMFHFMAVFFLTIGLFLVIIGVFLSIRAYRQLVEGKEATQMLELESEELFGVFVFCLGAVLAGGSGFLLLAFH